MKQTAVEFMINNIMEDHIVKKSGSEWEEIFKHAKLIDEKNLKDSFVAGAGVGEMFNNENRCYVTDAEQYLKETFKPE